MPDGPVVDPVSKESTFASHVTVALMEIGNVPYDGQVLPLVSPDGRFLASQSGEAPNWEMILAAGPQHPALGTRLLAYNIAEPAAQAEKRGGAGTVMKPIGWQGDLPHGLVLGRSCDNSGFLVEAPQANGSRWIGRVDWVSGGLRWLVQDGNVNAHAVISVDGLLAYSRRAVGSNQRELVVRRSGGVPGLAGGGSDAVLATVGVSYCFPVVSAEPGVVFVYALSDVGIELFGYKVPRVTGAAQGEWTVVGRRHLSKTADEAVVYQAVASLQIPLMWPGQSGAGSISATDSADASTDLLVFHPLLGRMHVLDRRTGSFRPLVAGSFAGAPALSGGRLGFLLTTQNSLKYMELRESSGGEQGKIHAQASEGVNVVAGSLLPRLTTNVQWPYVLVGPGQSGGEPRYRILKLRLGEPKS